MRAARAVGSCGRLGRDAIVSFTTPLNRRSIAVMERLGLARDVGADFDHPAFEDGNPLKRHILYRAAAMRFQHQRSAR